MVLRKMIIHFFYNAKDNPTGRGRGNGTGGRGGGVRDKH